MFPERLKYVRKLRGFSQEGLGKKINSTKSTISNYENDYSTPSNDVLKDLADTLNTTTDYLLGRSDYINDSDETEIEKLLNDPQTELMFNNWKEMSEEEREEAIRMINYIQYKKSGKKE